MRIARALRRAGIGVVFGMKPHLLSNSTVTWPVEMRRRLLSNEWRACSGTCAIFLDCFRRAQGAVLTQGASGTTAMQSAKKALKYFFCFGVSTRRATCTVSFSGRVGAGHVPHVCDCTGAGWGHSPCANAGMRPLLSKGFLARGGGCETTVADLLAASFRQNGRPVF